LIQKKKFSLGVLSPSFFSFFFGIVYYMVPAIPITSHISLGNVTNESLPDLVDLHLRVFPVSYGKKFYEEVMNAGELAKLSNKKSTTFLTFESTKHTLTLVYYDNQYAGAVCCRVEPSKYANFTARVYMMTLGVLKNYRNLGLGKQIWKEQNLPK
jgi:ribosomal protein S18 acetylase RimI-like enzyme